MVSVCMATFNGERFIRQQIDSILNQLSFNDELIISDDGSTDATIEIIKSYKDQRIKLLYHKKDIQIFNKNLVTMRLIANNFENAIVHTKGDYIFLSDQDDIWNFDKIKIMTEELKNNDMVMCNYSVINENGDIQKYKYLEKDPVSRFLIMNIINCPFHGCTIAFSKNVLSYCLPFPSQIIIHDYWIGCLVSIRGTYKFINEPLHLYRRHNNNASSTTVKSKNNFFIRISYRIDTLIKVLIRSLSSK